MNESNRQGDGTSTNLGTVRITRVPKPPGVVRVRFLGELDGIFTHWNHGTTPCFGDTCRHCKARIPREYRGYVAAEVRDTVRARWGPTVVEVTERMFWDLADTTLRGTVWDLYRESRGGNKTTCMAELVAEIDPKTLPGRFDICPVVSRLFRNLPVLWGALPELGAPLQLPYSVDPDAAPARAEAPQPVDSLLQEFPRGDGEQLTAYVDRIAHIRHQREGKA